MRWPGKVSVLRTERNKEEGYSRSISERLFQDECKALGWWGSWLGKEQAARVPGVWEGGGGAWEVQTALGLLGHGSCLSYFTKLLRWASLGLSFAIYTTGMMSAPNKSCKGDARQARPQTPL